jgi:ectoine hydroxylase-related dioxygenase (phytanoyl-CoA dioxygenase family)
MSSDTHTPRLRRRLRALCTALGPTAVSDDAGFVPAPTTSPRGGLFLEDYSTLPTPTSDLGRARKDMDVYGYCLLQDMLSPDACSALAARILEQANAEDQWSARLASTRRTQVHRSEAMPQWKGNAERNQQVRSLHNKGTEVVALLEDERMLEVIRHVIGEGFHANFLNCEVAKPGSTARDLHTDQWWMPPPQRASSHAPRIKTGSITREGAYEPGWASESDAWITPSLRCNAIWFAGDFHAKNGATMIVPCSHLAGRHPTKEEAANSGVHVGAIPVQGPAGTCCIYDGRLWHQIGQNTGDFTDRITGKPWRVGVFTHFVAPQMRAQENFTLSSRPELVAQASCGLRERLGLTAWRGVQGYVGELGYMSRRHADVETEGLATEYEQLQPPAQAAELTAQLEESGFCVVPDVVGPELVAALTARLADQASAERNHSSDSLAAADGDEDEDEEDGTRRVRSLLNKGKVFELLLRPSSARSLVAHVVGDEYQLSQVSGRVGTSTADVAQPPPLLQLQDTQWWMPQPIRKASLVPTVRPGDAAPSRASDEGWQGQSADWIAPPASAEVLWILEEQEVTVVARSHLSGRHPSATSLADLATGRAAGAGVGAAAVVLRVSAGSCVVLDGRTWYGVSSSGAHIDTSWVGPQFRTEENHPLSISADVLEGMDDDIKALIGWKVWHSYGQVPGAPYDGLFSRSDDPQLGVMTVDDDAPREEEELTAELPADAAADGSDGDSVQ